MSSSRDDPGPRTSVETVVVADDASTPALAAGTIVAGRFELGERIGRGSLSIVYAASDQITGRPVAIKLASPGLAAREDVDELARRFEREAAALAVIQSAHVVELISAGRTADLRPFLVLERLVGKNLAEVLADRGALEPSQVANVVGQAAAALELAHGLGIVHRDLKPANMFLHRPHLEGEAVVKVLDFGMVVDTAGPTERERDAFGGTPLFMAPEQVRGQLSRIGPATDIWALAFVALTLLTGEMYWTSANAEGVMREIESSAIERPSRRWPWLPEAFDRWFLRAAQRVPERRHRSAAVAASELAAALRDLRAPAVRGPTAPTSGTSSTVAARTPTPSVIRLSGRELPVVGRQVEVAAVEQQLAPGVIVTLTGAAGIGKTRLAQLACELFAERFVDGAWFVPLRAAGRADDRHSARDAALTRAADDAADEAIASAIASTLDIAPDTTRSMVDTVADVLASRRALVAIDGIERVPGAAPAIERLRTRSPSTSWIVTSRVPLGVAGEREHAVEPLDVPASVTIDASSSAIAPEEAATFSAVELFVRCARESVPMWKLSADDVADVVGICRATHGFPLGIELAAAQLSARSPSQIRAALEADSSVRGAVAWSYGLLADDQQRMLRQLAVMPAGLTFVQVKRVLAQLSGDPMYAVLRLVQTHLAAWSADPPRRLVMVDSVRELALEHARSLDEEPALWQLAARHATDVVESRGTMATDAWLALVDAEHANLRAVLSHLLAAAPADALELAGRLAYYWYLRGHYDEGARFLDTALARASDATAGARVRALHGAGRLALLSCRYDRAQRHLEDALALATASVARTTDALAVELVRGIAEAEQLLGSIARERGDYARSRRHHARSLALWEELRDAREVARARNYLLFAAWLGDARGDPGDEQRAWWERIGSTEDAEASVRALGDPELTVWTLLDRAAVLHYRGDPEAREVLARAFAEAVAARFHEGIAWSLDLIGKTSFARGELLQARAQLAASLRVHRRLGDRWRCASVLEALAAVAIASERPARAAMYLGAADAIRDAIGAPVPACERALRSDTLARGERAVGDSFAVGRERGRRMPLDQVVELAREMS